MTVTLFLLNPLGISMRCATLGVQGLPGSGTVNPLGRLTNSLAMRCASASVLTSDSPLRVSASSAPEFRPPASFPLSVVWGPSDRRWRADRRGVGAVCLRLCFRVAFLRRRSVKMQPDPCAGKWSRIQPISPRSNGGTLVFLRLWRNKCVKTRVFLEYCRGEPDNVRRGPTGRTRTRRAT